MTVALILSIYGATPVAAKTVTIQQQSTMRYLDAWVTPDRDYRIVTRTKQNNDTTLSEGVSVS